MKIYWNFDGTLMKLFWEQFSSNKKKLAHNNAEKFFDGSKYETLKAQKQNTFLRDIDNGKNVQNCCIKFLLINKILIFHSN